jgi:hypothetical protein
MYTPNYLSFHPVYNCSHGSLRGGEQPIYLQIDRFAGPSGHWLANTIASWPVPEHKLLMGEESK